MVAVTPALATATPAPTPRGERSEGEVFGAVANKFTFVVWPALVIMAVVLYIYFWSEGTSNSDRH